MTERTRKIVDSAWEPMPDTKWIKYPGAQCIAQEWRYPRWGCDTVQHMIDLMDELVRENERLCEGLFDLKHGQEQALKARLVPAEEADALFAASDAKEKEPRTQVAMNERSAFKIINDIPELQSLCYDCDILPEQVMDNPAAVRALCVIAALYLRYDDYRKRCEAGVESLKHILCDKEEP